MNDNQDSKQIPNITSEISKPQDWLIGSGSMADQIRNLDWSQTALGPRDHWPITLQVTVNSILVSPLPMAILWGKELLLIYNDAYLRITRTPEPHYLGQSAKIPWRTVWPTYAPYFERVMQKGEAVELKEHRYSPQDQTDTQDQYWISVLYSPIFAEKNLVAGVQLTVIDITAQKQLEISLREKEDRLNQALKGATSGTWECDLITRSFTFSSAIKPMFGFSDEQKTTSIEDWKTLLHPSDRENAIATTLHAIQTQNPLQCEYRVVKPDGKISWLYVLGDTRYKNGVPHLMTGICLDITQRKKLEEELRAAIDLRDEFMSVASHELKTPLTALHMQLQLLLRMASKSGAVSDSKIIELSKAAVGSAQDLANLLDELLDVTYIRVGKMSLDLTKMDLRQSLTDQIELIQESANQKGSSITFIANQSIVGRWDPIRISQVLSNLLSNAIKYGEGKPIEVTLSTDDMRKSARIEVQDAGIGISQEMQSKIFERFQRAISADKITGLGLGLYFVRQIIQAHNGTIRVESNPDCGSRFIVELPLESQKENTP